MELKILEEKNNELFGRREIKAKIDSVVAPGRLQILDSISKKFTVPLENIKILGVHGGFGANDFVVDANIYHSKEEMAIVELKKKKETRAVPAPAA